MTTKQGADELRMRALLLTRQVGPDAIPPKPTARPRDWLDEVIDTDLAPPAEAPAEPDPQPEPADQPATPRKAKQASKAKPKKKPKPGAARAGVDTRPASPRQSLIEAWGAVPYRLKWLAYHASAAYLGWTVGLVGWVTYVTAWIATSDPTSGQALFWYVTASGTALVYHRTRGWWWPVAWLAAVPVTSTVTGVLLYAPHP